MKRGIMLRQGKIVTCLAFGSAFIFAGLSLSFPVSATDPSSSATATVHVSEACSLTSTILSPHNDSMGNGTYTDSLGSTKFTVKCNDASGFTLYAIGYSGDEYGATSMLGDNELSIPTGTDASAGNTTSHWSMKISKDTTSYLPSSLTIENSFDSQHLIPSTYTKIASFPSSTDGINGTGSSILATYGVRISGTQAAGTYIGKVKYLLVHPSTTTAPVVPLGSSACPANSICYAPNASDIVGEMISTTTEPILTSISGSNQAGKQTQTENDLGSIVNITSYSLAQLIAPNYSRPGYGFAGWSTDFEADNSSTIYGPNETITVPDVSSRGLILYPVWIAKETSVTMQTFNSTNYSAYSSAAIGTVIALEDTRDNNIYAVAKLKDGKWWMIENLRLDNTATITTSNTHNPLHGANNNVIFKIDSNTTANHLAASNNTWCTAFNAACFDQTMLNTNNTNRSLTASYNGTGNSTYYQWYSYGNYYNWYSATAGNGTYSKTSGDVDGDLCPAGWHLPYGNSSGTGNTAGGFYYLNTLMSNDTSTQGSKDWRKFPNNFVYSGYFDGSYAGYRGSRGWYWCTSATSSNAACILSLSSKLVSPGTSNNHKDAGQSVRCVKSLPTIDDVESLQDFNSFSSQEMTSVLNSMTTGQAYHIPDNRDNESYTIAKLADGNVWMLDNLKLDLSNSSVKANLNSATTNAPDNALASLANNATDVSAIDSFTSPQIITAYKNNTNGTPYGNGSGKVGIYYNYCAVSAGTICDNSSTSDATYDICPAGWRLPTGGSGGEFQDLCLAYDSSCSNGSSSKTASDTTGVQYNLSRAPAGVAFGSLGIMSADSTLVLWSSTYYGFHNNDSFMYTMNLNNDNVAATASLVGDRRYGMSMRCIVNK